jgi:4-diphosphocytidyl-2-C-methyl-D-erythritol kinase
LIVFPNCKINLGLHILRKREDGFHDLETVFYPVPIHDALEVIRNTADDGVDFSQSGIQIDTTATGNICVKAYSLLKQHFPHLPGVKMHLHKVIPAGAGLGGGSADGAFTLKLLNEQFRLGLTSQQLLEFALQLGSDCPFFIVNQPAVGGGRGEQLRQVELQLGAYNLILVHPGIHVSTAWAFSQIQPSTKRQPLAEIMATDVQSWRDSLFNDFEQPVFQKHPELESIKQQLYNAGALYASMSGSGSSIFGIFEKNANPMPDFPAHYFVRRITNVP